MPEVQTSPGDPPAPTGTRRSAAFYAFGIVFVAAAGAATSVHARDA